jgi:hypothetical protein
VHRKGRYFDGAHVSVPFKAGLYTDEFTIEAWVKITRPFKSGFEYTLFEAGGRYATPPGTPITDRGFRIYESGVGRWQVRLGATELFKAPNEPPLVSHPGPMQPAVTTHLAVTVKKKGAAGEKTVTLYLNGKRAKTADVPSYAQPDNAPLFIGVENTTDNPANAQKLRTPVLCQIQEVVLHRKALSQEEIENHFDINKH